MTYVRKTVPVIDIPQGKFFGKRFDDANNPNKYMRQLFKREGDRIYFDRNIVFNNDGTLDERHRSKFSSFYAPAFLSPSPDDECKKVPVFENRFTEFAMRKVDGSYVMMWRGMDAMGQPLFKEALYGNEYPLEVIQIKADESPAPPQ